MHGGGDDRLVAAGDAHCHHQCLGRTGRAVVHRGVGDVHAGKLADHRLEFEDGLQRSLRDFRLIGGVGGEPFAARDERVDDDGPVVRVGAGAEERHVALGIFGGALAEELDDLAFRVLAWDVEVACQTIFGRNSGEQVVNRIGSDLGEHGVAIGLRFWKITHDYLWLSGR